MCAPVAAATINDGVTRLTLFALLLASCSPLVARVPASSTAVTPAVPARVMSTVPPPDEPPICFPRQSTPKPQLAPTRKATVPTVSARDDSWRRPALVPGMFLRDFQPSSEPYAEMICHDVYVFHGGNAEGRVTSALGAYPNPLGPGKSGPQLWLMGWHLRSLESHVGGVLVATVEQRDGFEGVWFDLRSVLELPDAGAVDFMFVDQAGMRVLPTITSAFRSMPEVYGFR